MVRARMLLAGILACVAVVLITILLTQASRHQVSAKILFSCVRFLNREERTHCYERTVYDLYPMYNVHELFLAIRTLQKYDMTLVPCHFLAHRLAAAVVAQDPARWSEQMISEETNSMCSFGYTHGIAIAKFKGAGDSSENIVAKVMPDLIEMCDKGRASARARNNCFHGLGHIFYYLTNGDIAYGLALCDQSVDRHSGDYEKSRIRCYAGVFMKLFFLTPDDDEPDPHLLDKRTASAFCDSLREIRFVQECKRSSWILYKDELIHKEAVYRFCKDMVTTNDMDLCFARVFRGLAWDMVGHLNTFVPLCEEFKGVGSRYGECYTAGALEYALTAGGTYGMQGARQFCNRTNGDARNACMQSLETLSSE
ncbi:MAG: hypothetical protein AAB421_05695 [Patescibacteria group bacterium]